MKIIARFRWTFAELFSTQSYAHNLGGLRELELRARHLAYEEGIIKVDETWSRMNPLDSSVEVVVRGEAGGIYDHSGMD